MMLSRRLLRGGFKFRRSASTKHAGVFADGGYAGTTWYVSCSETGLQFFDFGLLPYADAVPAASALGWYGRMN